MNTNACSCDLLSEETQTLIRKGALIKLNDIYQQMVTSDTAQTNDTHQSYTKALEL